MLSFILKEYLNGGKVSFLQIHSTYVAFRENLIKKEKNMIKWITVNNITERKGPTAINWFRFGNRVILNHECILQHWKVLFK